MSSSSPAAQLVLVRGGRDGDAGAGGAARPAPALSDADLARALATGDRRAAAEAWSRFLPLVRGTLRRLLGPGLDEDDLGQEVFLRFFRRVRDLREPAAVRSFLFGICLRVSRKEVRRRWLRRWLHLTADGALPENDGTGDAEGRAHEARAAVKRYYAILDAIGGEGRSLFVTRFIEELPLEEVARLHGLSVSTTQRRLGRVSKRVDAMVRGDAMLADMAGDGDGDGDGEGGR